MKNYQQTKNKDKPVSRINSMPHIISYQAFQHNMRQTQEHNWEPRNPNDLFRRVRRADTGQTVGEASRKPLGLGEAL